MNEHPSNQHCVRGLLHVTNELGLHARAATLLVTLAQKYRAKVTLTKDGQSVSATSVMAILLLGAARGSSVEVTAEGEDAQEAYENIATLFRMRFYEGK